MNSRERVRAVVKEKHSDRAPVCVWHHYFGELSFGKSNIDAQIKFDRAHIRWIVEASQEFAEKTRGKQMQDYLSILRREVRPALGCTEPAAVAYATAKAREVLATVPERVQVQVSGNILKNGMGVGIPGSDCVGLEIAAALGAVGGNAEAVLEVLRDVTPRHRQEAQNMVEQGNVVVVMAHTEERLYIEVHCCAGEDTAEVVIAGAHTNVVRIAHNGTVLFRGAQSCEGSELTRSPSMSMSGIYQFITSVPMQDIAFLQQGIEMNKAVAREGLQHEYGLGVGKGIWDHSQSLREVGDWESYAISWAAGAADARMAGCPLPVMTTAGSGNHGLTATLPVAVVARCLRADSEKMLRAVALSNLVTVHVKEKIGKLSALCGCGIGAAIGACCGILLLQDAALETMCAAVKNMVADISGIICDGAKAGCALKIATAVSSACRCAQVAMRNHSAGRLDGIVCEDIEDTLENLGRLVKQGMRVTDDVILEMMTSK